MIETAWSLAIRIALLLLRVLRKRGPLEPTYERLRLANMRRQDLMQWRLEMARKEGVRLGRDCRLFSYNVLSEPYLLEIGDDVIVSGDVTFVTHDGGVYLARDVIPNVQGNYGRIRIGNNCFIGMGAIILPNVQIGNNCVVAAGSVVNRSFGDNCVVMGSPAKTILSFDLYRALKVGSALTITSDEYPFPTEIPESVKRDLIENRLRDLPLPAPRMSRSERPGT